MKCLPGWRIWGLTILSMILMVVISIKASVKIADDNTQDRLRGQCEQLLVTIKAYGETPPTTPTGQNVQRATINYYQNLGCPEKLS